MKKQRIWKVLTGAFLAIAMSVSALSVNAAADDQPEKTLRVFSNRTESHVAYQILQDIVAQYQEEVNPNFKVEYECEPNLDQYKNKLKLYIAGDELPDMFQIDRGPIAEELTSQGKLVNMDEQLEKAGLLDSLDAGCRAYVANDDGSLYIQPEARYGNTIFYWKDQFEAAGITEPPTNFTEFLEVCAKLKENGSIPLGITGKASWNPLHVMYLPSFTVTGNSWLDQAKTGEVKFSEIPVVQDSANFLEELAVNEYFPAGFANIEYTDIMNGFINGQYAMVWCQSVYLGQFAEAYDEGRLGFLTLPVNDNDESYEQLATIAIQTGISWALNQETFDEETERFYQFLLSRYSDTCYKYDTYPQFNVAPPEDKSQIMKDYYEVMTQQTISWKNWDDTCDPVTGQLMGELGKELAQGMITSEEFLAQLDESAATNGAEYFSEN